MLVLGSVIAKHGEKWIQSFNQPKISWNVASGFYQTCVTFSVITNPTLLYKSPFGRYLCEERFLENMFLSPSRLAERAFQLLEVFESDPTTGISHPLNSP